MTDQTDQHLKDLTPCTPTDDVLDQLIVGNDQLLAALDEVIDVEAGLQEVLDRAKEA
ncbi:hypothetical protein [Streptomyces nigrescens]|uniref:hypothetical protein n=1 Tax=Streptomyces nigrescens TaxID=1920 RepID=UPI0036C716FC